MKKFMNIPLPGMRVIKTALAVFLCLVIVALLGEKYSGYSAIVAIVCMQKDWDDSISISKDRTIGTVIGASFGIATYKILGSLEIEQRLVLPYLTVCIMMIVLMIVMISLKKHNVTAVTCIIFLSVAVLRDPSVDVWLFALRRVMDTLIGIGISLLVNIVLTEDFFKKFNFFQ
ncbi:MAG: aromatic acid exporter family protein [Peptostreptococcaceae bacterium]|nr:aromatic acid exporter family protein [Peptostreptococcaceae bacterium]